MNVDNFIKTELLIAKLVNGEELELIYSTELRLYILQRCYEQVDIHWRLKDANTIELTRIKDLTLNQIQIYRELLGKVFFDNDRDEYPVFSVSMPLLEDNTFNSENMSKLNEYLRSLGFITLIEDITSSLWNMSCNKRQFYKLITSYCKEKQFPIPKVDINRQLTYSELLG